MKKGRVLVVDDEPSVVDALTTILRDTEYDAFAAVTARDAIKHAGRHKFDLAIIDLKLPDMSGLVALGAISEKSPGVVGILITVHDTPEVRADAMAAGFAAVLPKPFSPSALLDTIREVLPHRQTGLR